MDFTKKTRRDNITFVIKGKRLYAAKNVLAMVSPVFETIFSAPFEEKDKEEITMPEKRYEDFHEFLKCIYPTSPKPVDKDNVFAVLPLADEYQVTSLTRKCRDFLMRHLNENGDKMKSSEILKCYSMCHTYSVEGIREMCLSEMYRRSRSKIELDEVDVKHMDKDMLIQYQREMIVHLAKVNADIETKHVKSLMGMSPNLENAENVPGFENSIGVTLEHTVSNVFNLKSIKEPELSKQVSVWNAKFNIKAFITATTVNDKHLSVFLDCALPKRNKGWKCKVEFIICLKVPNTNGEKIVANMRSSHLFTDEKIDWGFKNFRKMLSLIEDLKFNDESTFTLVMSH